MIAMSSQSSSVELDQSDQKKVKESDEKQENVDNKLKLYMDYSPDSDQDVSEEKRAASFFYAKRPFNPQTRWGKRFNPQTRWGKRFNPQTRWGKRFNPQTRWGKRAAIQRFNPQTRYLILSYRFNLPHCSPNFCLKKKMGLEKKQQLCMDC